MVRFSPLFVDQLEDRCVPSANDPLVADVVIVEATIAVVETTASEPAPESLVIDPYLIDPSTPEAPKPDAGADSWGDPQSPVPPIGYPYWY
jgi:hypothetical protein